MVDEAGTPQTYMPELPPQVQSKIELQPQWPPQSQFFCPFSHFVVLVAVSCIRMYGEMELPEVELNCHGKA